MKRRLTFVGFAIGTCALVPIASTREATEPIVLQAQVVGAGATRMHGGSWTLDATVGQAQTGQRAGAAGLRLHGGFWQPRDASASDRIFADGFDSSP